MAQMYTYKVISLFFFSFLYSYTIQDSMVCIFFSTAPKRGRVCVCVSVCARSSSAAGTRLSIHQNYLSMKISIRLHRAGSQFSLSLFLSPTSLYAVHRVKEYREKEYRQTHADSQSSSAQRGQAGVVHFDQVDRHNRTGASSGCSFFICCFSHFLFCWFLVN